MHLKSNYEKLFLELKNKYGDNAETIFNDWVKSKGIEDNIEQKSYFFHSEIKSINEDDEVIGYISTGDPDYYNDIVSKECLDDMFSQMNDKTLKIDVEHESFRGKDKLEKELNKTLNPIAKVVDKFRDTKGILVKTILNKAHRRYQEIKDSIRNGFLDAFSIAYIPLKIRKEIREGKEYRILEKVLLLNATFTGMPVNSNASFTEVALKSIQDFDDSLDEVELKSILNEIDGGINMNAEELKSMQEKVDAVVLSSEELKSKIPELEKSIEELKSLNEVLSKEKAELSEELKSFKENVEAKAKEYEVLDAKLKDLEVKSLEVDKVLSSPQFKSKVEQMNAVLNGEPKKESRGPLDYI